MNQSKKPSISQSQELRNLFRSLGEVYREAELLNLFSMTPTTLAQLCLTGDVDFSTLNRIVSTCGFSHANFKIKGIDHGAVIGKLQGHAIMPLRYSSSNYSSKKTSHSFLHNLPNSITIEALKFAQIEDEKFFDPERIDNKISTLMNSDLLQYFQLEHRINDFGLYRLGRMSGHYHQDKPFGRSFKGLSVKESVSKVIEEIINHFETSYRYTLVSLTDEKAIIQRNLSEQILDEQKVSIYSNPQLCHFIQGSFSAISFYSSGKFARTTEEKCIFKGDDCCEFHLAINDLKPLF